MPSINFYSESVSFTFKNKGKFKKFIVELIKREKKLPGEINYVFCSDDFLADLNKNYLRHDTLTDIITFDYSDAAKISGDIFISIERVKENAAKFKRDFENELYRVMIHGVLHLVGYKDKSKKDKALMRQKEDFYLAIKN